MGDVALGVYQPGEERPVGAQAVDQGQTWGHPPGVADDHLARRGHPHIVPFQLAAGLVLEFPDIVSSRLDLRAGKQMMALGEMAIEDREDHDPPDP